jgi:hypothetical protein
MITMKKNTKVLITSSETLRNLKRHGRNFMHEELTYKSLEMRRNNKFKLLIFG